MRTYEQWQGKFGSVGVVTVMYDDWTRDREVLIAERESLLSQVKELQEAGRKAAEGGVAAANELMTEFLSKTRAANWGVINQGLLDCDALLALLIRIDKALEERKK